MPTERFMLDNNNFDKVFSLLLDKINDFSEKTPVFVNGNEILGMICLAHKNYLDEVHNGIKSRKQKNSKDRKTEDRIVKVDSLLSLAFDCTQAIASLYSKEFFTRKDLINALNEIEEMLYFRFRQKGPGAYSSSHEILGILQEEYVEFEEEVKLDVKSRKADTLKERELIDRDEKIKELKDIAVGAIWGIASIQTGTIDW